MSCGVWRHARNAAAAIFLGLLLWAPTLRAHDALVVLVRPAETNPLVTEALTRIHGELVADGFHVVLSAAAAGLDPEVILDQAAKHEAPATLLGLFVRRDGSADLWLVDQLTRNKTLERRLEVVPQSTVPSAEVLARRIVDLVHASLGEMSARSRESQATLVPASAAPPPGKISTRPQLRWASEAGVMLIGGFGGIDAALLPALHARYVFHESFATRLTLAGLGTRPIITHAPTHSSASVSQTVCLVEVLSSLGQAGKIRPLVLLGAGTYQIAVRGTAAAPYEGRTASHWVFAADFGLGLAFPLSSRFELGLESHALFTTPLPVIRFANELLASAGQPSLWGALSVVAWL